LQIILQPLVLRSSTNSIIVLKMTSLVVMSSLLISCGKKDNKLDMSIYPLELRDNWPEIEIPGNNPLYVASVEFGKQLFFDRRLSVDSTVSCTNCHKHEFGFADAIPLSVGVKGRLGFRNSGSLTNVAYLPYFNRDGGVRTLDRFSLVPLEDHDEMDLNLLVMRDRLSQDKSYIDQAKTIYNRRPDAFAVSRALASYLRTFISDNSPYDRYVYDGDTTAMNASQKRGYHLFFGDKAKCSTCHNGINLTNYKFENNGLYADYKGKDRGRQRITDNPNDEGKFRVASLRNIALTAPYMHDGSLTDLEEVLDHYQNHGKSHPTINPDINQINITDSEKADLISFLGALTDSTYIQDSKFQITQKMELSK
jgi:cytochrome c peroxidase